MAGGEDNSKRLQALITQRDELVKQFIVLDAQGRSEFVYTAHTDQVDGGFCSRVQYAYFNPTTTQVEKMKETNDVWLAAYDI